MRRPRYWHSTVLHAPTPSPVLTTVRCYQDGKPKRVVRDNAVLNLEEAITCAEHFKLIPDLLSRSELADVFRRCLPKNSKGLGLPHFLVRPTRTLCAGLRTPSVPAYAHPLYQPTHTPQCFVVSGTNLAYDASSLY